MSKPKCSWLKNGSPCIITPFYKCGGSEPYAYCCTDHYHDALKTYDFEKVEPINDK